MNSKQEAPVKMTDENVVEVLEYAHHHNLKDFVEAARVYLTRKSLLFVLGGTNSSDLLRYWNFASSAKMGWLQFLILQHPPSMWEFIFGGGVLSDMQNALRTFPPDSISRSYETGEISVRVQNHAQWAALTTTLAPLHITSLEVGLKDLFTPVCNNLLRFKCLQKLSLFCNICNPMTEADVKALSVALEVNKTLNSVVLSFSHLDESRTVVLSKGLKVNTTVNELNLRGNEIGKGTTALAEVLKVNTALRKLDLSENQLDPAAAKALAKGLQNNSTLQEMNLKNNELGAEGAIAFAEAWKKHKALTSVDLSHNEIGLEGAKAIAEALKDNTALEFLDLSYNKITPEGVQLIAEALKGNTTLCAG